MTLLRSLRVAGYRSLYDLEVPLGRVTVLVGANGTGKTNVYQALRLAQHAATGTLGAAIASEGGLPSMLWAGQRKRGERARVDLALTFEDLEYQLVLGMVPPTMPPAPPSPFDRDPEVKEESVVARVGRRPVTLLERSGKTAQGRDAEGNRASWPVALWDGESVLAQVRDPGRFPVLAELSARLRLLRFHHHFAIDAGSPIRVPQPGVRTPLLADDGRDLAAAIATIDEIGDGDALHAAIQRALGGVQVEIDAREGVFALRVRMPGLGRALDARELSDGTLRFLCLVTALTAPRPPAFMALNEPESSLHPDVLPALAERIAACSRHTQIIVTTHSDALARAITERTGTAPIRLERALGATRIAEE